MRIKIDCPRCKQSLGVPRKKAGHYVACPRCKGRLWVPEEAASAVPEGEGGGESPTRFGPMAPSPAGFPGSAPPNPQPSGTAPAGQPGPAPAGAAPVWVQPLTAGSPPVPPPSVSSAGASLVPAVRPRNVARFISGQAATSTLQPLADGKLPDLRLNDGTPLEVSAPKAKAVSPLVLLALLCLSVAMSVLAVLVDPDPPNKEALHAKAAARRTIADNYFPSDRSETGTVGKLAPYQVLLTEAHRAYSRGDRANERKMYHNVLDLLRAERGTFQRGLTGSQHRDRLLEKQITILLRED